MKTIEHSLQNIMKLAGAIQIDADSKEHTLDWKKVHEWARDVVISAIDIRNVLGLNRIEDGLIDLTEMLDEHPEGYDGPCWCMDCRESAQ